MLEETQRQVLELIEAQIMDTCPYCREFFYPTSCTWRHDRLWRIGAKFHHNSITRPCAALKLHQAYQLIDGRELVAVVSSTERASRYSKPECTIIRGKDTIRDQK
jgi:hypothetical protein